MPYRASARTHAAALFAQLCAKCGAEHRSEADAMDFVCSVCRLEQPTLPAEPPEKAAEVEVTGYEKRTATELVAFATTLELKEQCSQIRLKVDGADIHVTLSFNSGLVDGVDLTTPMTGFPRIDFSREGASEVKAKARGTAREVQTGDPLFDDKVYIDSDAPDGDVLAFVAAPSVRLAIVELLRSAERIRISPLGIRAHFRAAEDRAPQRLYRLITLFRVLMGTRRPLVVRRVPASLAQRATFISLYAALGLGIVGVVAGRIVFPLVDFTLQPRAIGIGLGLSLVPQFFLHRIMRGRSSSGYDLAIARMMSLFGIVALTTGGSIFLNGALDNSPEREQELTVLSASHDSESKDTDAVVGGDGTESLTVEFDDPREQIKVGNKVKVWTKPGRLGGRWFTRPAIANADGVLLKQ